MWGKKLFLKRSVEKSYKNLQIQTRKTAKTACTMEPLQLKVTWYGIRHARVFVLAIPVRNILSSMVDCVPHDRQLQRDHSLNNIQRHFSLLKQLSSCQIRRRARSKNMNMTDLCFFAEYQGAVVASTVITEALLSKVVY